MNTGLKQDRRAKLRAAAARVKASLKPEFQPLGADEIMGFLRGDEHVSAPKRVSQPNHQGRMISPPLFTACVPVLLRYLQTLSRLLDAVEFHAALPAADLLAAWLADDMMPLARQVETACHLALRTALPLAGRPVPVFEPSVNSVQGLQATVRRVAHQVAQLRPDDFAGAEQRVISETAGEAPLALPAWTFLCEFALPNFLFHVSMAYAIARSQGCRLGKAQFDGWHVYGAAPRRVPSG